LIRKIQFNQHIRYQIKTIYNYVVTDPVVLSLLPDDTYVVNDGNHRANLLNLLHVNNIPSIVDGEFEPIKDEGFYSPMLI
jgi:hypothetical protein